MTDLIHVGPVYEDAGEPKGRRRGQKTKCNAETTAKIVRFILDGNFQEVAAGMAGVCRSAYFNWLARGREALAAAEAAGPKGRIPASERPYVEFVDAIEKARDVAEGMKVSALSRIAEGRELKSETLLVADGEEKVLVREYHRPDGKAIIEWLQRSFPDRWGPPRAKIEHSGPEGGAIPVEVEVSARDSLRSKLKLISDRVEKEAS